MEVTRPILFTICILSSLFLPTKGLYGYDCGDQVSNLTTISLLEVGECNIKTPVINVTSIYGQLVQLNEFGVVPTFKCSIKITRIVTHCGMHSHISRVSGGEISYYKEVTREECWAIQSTGFLSLAGMQILGVRRNSTIHKSIVLAGSSDQHGRCKGSTYTDPYGSYQDVYVAGWVEVALQDSYREVHIETNRIRLASGVTCVFSEGQCIDDDASHVFWNFLPEDVCGVNKYTVLYEGNLDKIYEYEENRVMYSLETNDITFALWKKGEQGVCGFRLSRTEHPKLFVPENARENGIYNKKPTATANLDIFAYVNLKFLYVENFWNSKCRSDPVNYAMPNNKIASRYSHTWLRHLQLVWVFHTLNWSYMEFCNAIVIETSYCIFDNVGKIKLQKKSKAKGIKRYP